MAERYEHLTLHRYGGYERRRRRGGGGYVDAGRDRRFYAAQKRKIGMIAKEFEREKEEHKKYLDPRLIFKVGLNGKKIDRRGLQRDLRAAGISVISSAFDDDGYWVAFADDAKLTKFVEKLDARASGDKATFIDCISGIERIPPDEKMGPSLKATPLAGGKGLVDVDVWKMEVGMARKFTAGLLRLVADNGGEVTDNVVTESLHMVRVLCDDGLLRAMAGLSEVSWIDRVPHANVGSLLEMDVMDAEPAGPPAEGSPAVLVLDSGVRHHPLLKASIAGHIPVGSHGGRAVRATDDDDVGHGTSVASIALYGDVRECAGLGRFYPGIWIYSAKMLYRDVDGEPVFDSTSLLEGQIRDAVDYVAKNHPECRIVNVSFGDDAKKMSKRNRQFSIASMIDELSEKHRDIIFVISAGNNMGYVRRSASRLEAMARNPESRIIDPATSAYGVTVGSVFGASSPGAEGIVPSRFTCVGPGLRGAVKPELVDHGGSSEPDVMAANAKWVGDGRLFTLTHGTSASAPRVAHTLARIVQEFPDASRNRVKALLLSSASPPRRPPGSGGAPAARGSGPSWQDVWNVYGHGRADLGRALRSGPDRVVLAHSGRIGVDRTEIFPVNVPEEFFTVKGPRSIGVSLAFDPPTDRDSRDYLGATMDYTLIKDLPVEEVAGMVRRVQKGASEPVRVPKKNKIDMLPGPKIRKWGIHQKSVRDFFRAPSINPDMPLVLAVSCQNRWVKDDYVQPYSVVMTLEHSAEIGLYEKVRSRNRARAQARGR